MTLPVPQAPPLAHLANVELMHAGTWEASTGIHTFTADDFAHAVAALDCPAVRRPVLKLGHTDPRFDGEPAIGYVTNLHTISDGHGLAGDYAGMPGWMTPEVLASAYPDRSVEGQWDYRCALGHTHPFVLTGVAFLGTTEPAIGTLTSLQDIAALYGVAASAPSGTPVTIHLKGEPMPNPKPRTVAAGVTTEDVRRAYYETAPWSEWIEEMHLDPLQLIVIDDEDGSRSRVPIEITGTDGAEGVTFGTPVPVVVRYEDASTPAAPADPAAPAEPAVSASILRYANRAESRPGAAPRASTTPGATRAAGSHPKGGSTVALTLTDDQESALREALGLADDADGDALVTAVEDLTTTDDPAASGAEDGGQAAAAAAGRVALPDGVVAIDSDVLSALQRDAKLGRDAAERQTREDHTRVVDAALGRGAITPARREHYLKLMAADPDGTKALLEGLPDELAVPLTEVGHGQGDEVSASTVRESATFKNWSI